MRMSEEEFLDDEDEEYISDDNDVVQGIKVIEEEVTIVEDKEEVIEHEEIIHSIQGRNDAAMQQLDHIMEEKVLDSLRRGTLK